MTPSMSEVRRWFSHHCSAMRPPLEWPITRILVFGHIAWICVTSVLSLATSSWMVVVATSSDVYACSVTTLWAPDTEQRAAATRGLAQVTWVTSLRVRRRYPLQITVCTTRREDSAPVTADEESFTAVWRHAIRSMTSSQLAGTSSLEAITVAGDAAARAALHTAHPERPREAAPLKARPESRPEIPARHRPARRGRGPWNRAPSPPLRGTKPCPHSGSGTTKPDSKTDTEHESSNNPERRKHLKSLVLSSARRT